jgi:hypothetical protein
MSGPAVAADRLASPGVERRALEDTELEEVMRRMLSGPHATVGAATRSRELTVLARAGDRDFELLMPAGGDLVLTTGPVERLVSELVAIPHGLETLAGVSPAGDVAPGAIPGRGLGAGEALALAEIIRRGNAARIDAACQELEIAGLPWWISQFAWGAEAVISLVLVVDGTARVATMLQLLSTGWGCLHVDSSDDLHFRPLTSTDVQARMGAFVAILRESAYAA